MASDATNSLEGADAMMGVKTTTTAVQKDNKTMGRQLKALARRERDATATHDDVGERGGFGAAAVVT